MTTEFDRFYAFLAPVEGGEVDHDLDRGGATWYGISSRFLTNHGLPAGPLTKETAKRYAREFFWQDGGCDDMDPIVAWCYCDARFHHTPAAAARLLQYALAVNVDGVVGAKTREAARARHGYAFWNRYRAKRVRLFTEIMRNDNTQLAFSTGWNLRLHQLGDALVANGMFKGEMAKMPWYKGPNVKAAGAGAGLFGLALAFLFPEFDADSLSSIIQDPAALKATIVGILGTVLAKWRAPAR